MRETSHYSPWKSYTNYVRRVILPNHDVNVKDLSYWRNEIFCSILTFLAPVSIVALVPGIYMSFSNALPVVGFADLLAFAIVILLLVNRSMSLRVRKSIFILMAYGLCVVLLYYLSMPGPGLLFLLVITVFSSVIYSSSAGFYSAWVNTFLCIGFGLLIYCNTHTPIADAYTFGTWIAVSSNLVFLSVVCAVCLNLLLKGFEASLADSKKLSANLISITENTDAMIYSLDSDFRYITFNQVMKHSVKKAYHVEIKNGSSVFEFLEKASPEEVLFWKNVYTEALNGKAIQFEKDFSFGEKPSTTSFSFNPIVEDNTITGLSCFAVDITERKNAQREIQKLYDELEIKVMERTEQLASSNKELEAFSYSVSHDLRMPLRAVHGYAQMLKDHVGTQLDAEGHRLLNNIMTGGKRMGNLIDDLLTFSRLGRKEMVNMNIPIIDMVTDICRELKNDADNTNHSIEFKLDELHHAHGDVAAIKQVWVNLLFNAVKYSGKKEKAVIEVGSEIKENEIIYHIKDNGVGFDMKYVDKLFGVFQRLHLERDFEGTGVGLAIVHRIVVRHGGKVWADARENEGATFYFSLPIAI